METSAWSKLTSARCVASYIQAFLSCATVASYLIDSIIAQRHFYAVVPFQITDSTNQTKAWSWFSLASGIGTIVGALIGGILARPACTHIIFHHRQ